MMLALHIESHGDTGIQLFRNRKVAFPASKQSNICTCSQILDAKNGILTRKIDLPCDTHDTCGASVIFKQGFIHAHAHVTHAHVTHAHVTHAHKHTCNVLTNSIKSIRRFLILYCTHST